MLADTKPPGLVQWLHRQQTAADEYGMYQTSLSTFLMSAKDIENISMEFMAATVSFKKEFTSHDLFKSNVNEKRTNRPSKPAPTVHDTGIAVNPYRRPNCGRIRRITSILPCPRHGDDSLVSSHLPYVRSATP